MKILTKREVNLLKADFRTVYTFVDMTDSPNTNSIKALLLDMAHNIGGQEMVTALRKDNTIIKEMLGRGDK